MALYLENEDGVWHCGDKDEHFSRRPTVSLQHHNTITYDYEPRTAAAAAALDAVAADLIKNSHSPGYVVQSTALLRRLVC